MRLFSLMACLALGACAVPATTTGGVLTTSPAPLANSVAARQAVVTAYKAFGVAITAVDLAYRAGAIKGGSASALQIAGLNDRINAALKAANAAIDAGSESDYSAALTDAQKALSQLQTAMHGG